jgi:hypothetical protein
VGAAGLAWLGLSSRRRRQADPDRQLSVGGDRHLWRMGPLASLRPPVWSRGQRIGMIALRVYLLVAVLLLAVKIGQLALAH